MGLMQSIPLDSIQNARELGGYTMTDGSVIKKGLLLRTAKLSGISNEDIDRLVNRYRVSDIVDFRNAFEMPGFEDPAIPGAVYHQTDVMTLPDGIFDDDMAFDMNNVDFKQLIPMLDMIGMTDGSVYIAFLEGDKGVKGFGDWLRILLNADPDRAVLWHCTSGKDRTGLSAMLILSALGADEKLIMNDYLLTNTYNAKRIAGLRMILKQKGMDDESLKKAVLAFEAVDELFMRRSLEHLNSAYGSVVGYIRNRLGLSESDIASLKAKYLEG